MCDIKRKAVDKQKRQWIWLLIFFELMSVLLCFDAVVNCKEVQEKDCNFIVGKIDEIYSRHRGGFIIYIGGKECRTHFPKRQLNSYIDDIMSQANIKILTTQNYHLPFFSSEESVVEIRSQNKVYYSIDQYNDYIRSQRTFDIIVSTIFGVGSSLGLLSAFGVLGRLKYFHRRIKKRTKKEKFN